MWFELAFPKRVTFSEGTNVLKIISANNKINNVYRSIYNFNQMDKENKYRPDYNSAIVDRIEFDFDDEINGKEIDAWSECLKLHNFLCQENLAHTIKATSQNRYGIVVYCKKIVSGDKKSFVRNGQLFFINKLNLECDPHIVGDLARIMRVIGTYNVRRKAFCISLSKDELKKGNDYIYRLLSKPRFKIYMIGSELFDLSKVPYQKAEYLKTICNHSIDINSENIDHHLLWDSIPDCARRSLLSEPYFRERFNLIMTLKDTCGFLKEEVITLLKHYFPKYLFEHCIHEERQVDDLFRRNTMRPSYKTLQREGFCKADCNCTEIGTYFGEDCIVQ